MGFDITKVIEKDSKKEIINEIFNQVYVTKTAFLRDNTAQLIDAKKTLENEGFSRDYIDAYTIGLSREKATGFYIQLPLNVPNMDELNPIFRMFFTIEKESKKIMIGEETALDTENILQNARLYIVECLNELIDGSLNEKLEKFLKIHNLNDFRLILLDEQLSRRLSNFTISYVKFKLINLTKSSANPDFEVVWDKHEQRYIFKKVKKFYLDKRTDEDSGDGHEIVEGVIEENAFDIAADDNENDDNTFIAYVVENYIHKCELTNIQKKFWDDALKYGLDNRKLKEIYSKQQINQFKKQILKRLESKLEKDPKVAFMPGFKICKWRTYFERDGNGKFIYVDKVDKQGNVKKKRVTKLDEYGEKVKEKYYQEVPGRWVLVEKYYRLKNNGMGK